MGSQWKYTSNKNSKRTQEIFVQWRDIQCPKQTIKRQVHLCKSVITQTAGAHSVASITVAFFRPFIVNYSFGKNNELTHPLNTSISLSNRMIYILSIILLHQLIFSFFAFFSFSHGYKIMLYFVVNSLFSFGIIIASLYLFRPKEWHEFTSFP